MLHNLDLDRSQESVYRHLVEAGTATAETLARACALE
ncbi:LuxR family transcriptional regulator, partial [Streptomyces sp. SID11233]|nr:LuxR family transcriptional regulator [Streptomyces sp. SID11233]